MMSRWMIVALWCCWTPLAMAGEQQLTARDTLAPADESQPDARECLDGLCWKPRDFTVTVQPAQDADYQAVIRFPSPVESGSAINDLVSGWWYEAHPHGETGKRPTLVIVHESGSAMPVAQLFAKAFAAKGIHALLVHLPNYGLRRQPGLKPTGEQFFLAMKQAIADVRRARDAAAVLPGVDDRRISVQGTSLGGFVTATVAGLDHGFDQAFIMVAGGDIVGLVQRGQREAAELRHRLEEAGYTGEKLRTMLSAIEPNRLAHRVHAERTWLYSALQDRVVPPENSRAFAKAAGLDADHHVQLWGDHVTTIVFMPVIVDHVVQRIKPDTAPRP